MTLMRPTPTLEENRQRLITGRLIPAVVGEVVEMPWGERVRLLPEGERAHEMPLMPNQMESLRAVVAGDQNLRTRLLRLLLGR